MRIATAALIFLFSIGSSFAQSCSGCGCKGGPGYRGPDGKCVGWAALKKTCGTPPTERCSAEGAAKDDDKPQE